MTDKTDIAALRPSERAKLGLVTDDNTGGYYVAECEECGKIFPSQNCDGGGQIADTGDYGDCYCPHCGHVDPEVCENANLVWNVQQLKIINLTSQFEAERQRADAAHKYGSERDSENESLMLTVGRLRVEIAELKGDQKPYGYYSAETETILEQQGHASISAEPLADSRFPLFTAPQKPVVLAPNRKDMCWTAANAGFVAKCDSEWKAVIEAAGGIVKDGE